VFRWPLVDDVELRLLSPADAPALAAAVRANAARLAPWLSFARRDYDVADARAFIARAAAQYGEGRGFQAGIFRTGALVGVVGFHPIDWHNRTSALGYWLCAEAEGQGIMTAACRALVGYAFDVLELNRMEIRARPDNVRSRAVAERLGFRLEGILRASSWDGQRFVDHAVYGLLRAEWCATAP
jgi:ribosomal-protein-serine acetyltransferase